MFRIVAIALAVSSPVASVADPVSAPAPLPQPFVVTNAGPAAIVHLTVTPMQSAPSNINQLQQPLGPFTQQPISISSPQQCCYQIQAVYSDGHTVTIPFWNINNVPTLTIRYGQPH